MQKRKILYIIIIFALCLIPSAGLLFTGGEESAENRSLSERPKLISEEGEVNTRWLSEVGDYFQDHFAFRSRLVTANARLRSSLFGVSADDGVIDGTDGWLYYMDSLDDYLGRNLLEDRELFNIAHSLSLMQEYAEGKGIRFLFVPVPNKNTLYGEHMPHYYGAKVSDESNRRRLLPYLDAEGVRYLDLEKSFGEREETLYHKTDSHWTNRGAGIAADEMFAALGMETRDWENRPYEVKKDFRGDLAVMLYPEDVTPEEEIYYEQGPEFQYKQEVPDNFQPKIWTEKGNGTGSLVMYRDSFGNALLPFMADGFGTAYFSRGEPFYLTDLDVNQADTLIVERVERFLPNLAKNVAVMEAPLRDIVPEGEPSAVYEITGEADGEAMLFGIKGAHGESVSEEEISCKTEGTGLRIEGVLGASEVPENGRIYARINGGGVYEAFPITLGKEERNPFGYRLVLNGETAETLLDGESSVKGENSVKLELFVK